MRIVRLVSWLVIPVGALLIAYAAAAQGSLEARQACTPDAMRLCGDLIPDVAKVTRCMVAKKRFVSPACRMAMGHERKARYGHGAAKHRKGKVHHHCGKHHRHCS